MVTRFVGFDPKGSTYNGNTHTTLLPYPCSSKLLG